MTTPVRDVLDTRQNTHGDFATTAEIAQALKVTISSGPNWMSLSSTQRETLDMLATKLARILSGNHNERDHWVDAIGYLTLTLDTLELPR